MPSASHLVLLDAEFAIAETLGPDPSGASYPYPPLQLSPQLNRGQFEAVVLENQYLSATIVPALGGRVVALHDKRTSSDIFSLPSPLLLVEGGRRGVRSPFGIQLITDGRERLNATGPVDFSFRESENSENEPAILWIAESAHWPLSFHLRFELEPDRAELLLETRIFNRSSEAAHYNGGLLCAFGLRGAFESSRGFLWWAEERSVGVEMESEELSLCSLSEESISACRFSGLREMGPHQVDSWTAVFRPYSKLRNRPFVSAGAAAAFSEDGIELVASRSFDKHKLLLLTRSGATLEAMAELTPDHPISLSLGEAERDPDAIALISPSREEVFRASPRALPRALTRVDEVPGEALGEVPRLNFGRRELLDASFRMQHKSWAHYLQGVQALWEREFETADFQFEQALLFNGEDPLCWWMKALANRHLGDEEEPAALPNAHYLAPLEPTLRVEALLGQPLQEGFGANPLLGPLAAIPENLVEVACHLMTARLYDDASRWIEESLRHVDLPMLRYLMAYCLVAGSRMTVEAAQQVRVAASAGFIPPFPHRPVEREALTELSARFPDDSMLRRFFELIAVA